MRIIFDGYGGDNTPDEAILAARQAVDKFGVSLTLVGDSEALLTRAGALNVELNGIDVKHAPSVITMEDEPGELRKSLKDCSMAVGLQMLRGGEGDAFVSGGNTGALVMGGTTIVGRLKGIKRASLTTVIPCEGGQYLLSDVGANVDCRPEMLVQFALMGSAYMEKILGVQNPRVGIANIGEESHKGTALQQETYKLMQNAPVNFIGNAEVRDVPLGCADVVVCDGFTGNMMLKLTEGLAKMFTGAIKGVMMKNAITKLGAMTMMGGMKDFKAMMDYKKYGGAPLLGLKQPVIKAHGSSNAEAFLNAIGQAVTMVQNDVVGTIDSALIQLKDKQEAGSKDE